jgi:hypothetical protein
MGEQMNSLREERRKQVHAMRINFSLEDMYPDADDLALQEAYIRGHVTISHMLEHARAFADRYSQHAASSSNPSECSFCRIVGITKNDGS